MVQQFCLVSDWLIVTKQQIINPCAVSFIEFTSRLDYLAPFPFIVIFVIVVIIFLGQFCPRGKGTMRSTLYEAPTRETRSDHNTGNYVPSSFQ